MERKASSGGRGRSAPKSGAKFIRTCLSWCNILGKVENAESSETEEMEARSAEVRLLCSYGGRLTPLNSLNYSQSQIYRGGENRFIAVDRRCSAADLLRRLSTDFLGGQSFTLKYQVSGPALNAFITVETDEDLRFMIEECDRLTTPFPTMGKLLPPPLPLRLPPPRGYLRVFLTPPSAETGVVSRAVSPTVPRTRSSDDDDEFSEDYDE